MALNKNEKIGVFIGVIVAFAFILLSSGLLRVPESDLLDFTTVNEPEESEVSGELVVEDLVVGSGEEASLNSVVTVHYVGVLEDGRQFDSSRDRGEPVQFVLSVGQVIEGWVQGLQGMRVGGTRRLTIPSELGYGSLSIGGIPANSTLIFEVELLAVEEIAGDSQ